MTDTTQPASIQIMQGPPLTHIHKMPTTPEALAVEDPKVSHRNPMVEKFCINIAAGVPVADAVKAVWPHVAKQSDSWCRNRGNAIIKYAGPRIAEIQRVTNEKAIAQVQERKELLTAVVRQRPADILKVKDDIALWPDGGASVQSIRFDTKTGVVSEIRFRDIDRAVDTLNRMEKIYAEAGGNGPNVNIGIIVMPPQTEARPGVTYDPVAESAEYMKRLPAMTAQKETA